MNEQSLILVTLNCNGQTFALKVRSFMLIVDMVAWMFLDVGAVPPKKVIL